MNAFANAPEVKKIPLRSGDDLAIYHFDTSPNPERSIFFVSGSGCVSLRYFLKDYFAGLPSGYRVYAAQKKGVAAFETGASCSEKFIENYSFKALLETNKQGLIWSTVDFGKAPTAIIGVSEGGTLAAALAAENPEIENLVIIGAGGMTFRTELEILAERRGNIEQLQRGFAAIEKDPSSTTKTFWGHPHAYWSSMLDINPMEYFAVTTQKVFIFAGALDESVPSESPVLLANTLREDAGRTVIIDLVSGANHILKRDGEDLKPQIMSNLDHWFQQAHELEP
ncbi:MAG: prolyl oligopeptidase family serine peptidase [Hyphomonas sp.]